MATLIDPAFTTDDYGPSRDELTEALAHHAATLKRMPAHWVERRAGIHDLINGLLDDLEALDRGQATAPHA